MTPKEYLNHLNKQAKVFKAVSQIMGKMEVIEMQRMEIDLLINDIEKLDPEIAASLRSTDLRNITLRGDGGEE
jgi:K+/H+ antiporter YhaU regulatory subunit KhtT